MRTTRKNRRYELPEEVLAVLESSPNLEPCEEFRYADIHVFVKYLNEKECEQCMAWFRQTDKELKTIALLSDYKKGRIQ
jgi:hypothetical protein